MAGVRRDYACADGSAFPVTFAHPGDVALRWVVDREHAPTAMTPLAGAVRRVGRPGAELAYRESGLEMASTLRRDPPDANGYDYYVENWLPEGERASFEQGVERLAQQYGDSGAVWSRHTLPRVRQACSSIETAPPDTPFRILAERRAYAVSHTGVAGAVAKADLLAVASYCQELFGDRATFIAHQLAQGYANETISADVALLRIARAEPGSPEAKRAREEFLQSYGLRATSWSIDHATALERPELLDAQLRLLRHHHGPGDLQLEAARRRHELAKQVAARLVDDGKRATFERLLVRLESFVPVREVRAHWQLVVSGMLRRAVRARGRQLVDQGVIDAVDDVFFLTPDEYDEPAGNVTAAVPGRRAEHACWASVTPPPVIGDIGCPDDEKPGVVKGAPGAPGLGQGPARVILDLADAERLQPGDVLVTTMTSPPWTPMFGIASAVVTDAGDAMSHVAIAAREYGIPCVVGTDYATVRIRDGAPVTVDGDAGTVVLL